MSLTLEKYSRLKRRVDQLQREHDKAVGALEETQARLKSEFDCPTIKRAERLLAKLEQEAKELEQEFNKELKKFEKEMSGHADHDE